MSDEDKLPSGWIRVKSKSHPDKEYFYNAKLKRSVWKIEDIRKSSSSFQRRSSSTKSPDKRFSGTSHQYKLIGKKNGARSRMKNLQKNLQLELKQNNHEISKPQEKVKSQVDKDNRKNVASDRMKKVRKQLDQEVDNEASTSASNEVELMDVSFEEEEPMQPMEWEPIDEEKLFEEIEKIRSDNNIKIPSNIQILNDSTLKISSEFYIVIDTNILIANLDFVKEIKGKYFKGKIDMKLVISRN